VHASHGQFVSMVYGPHGSAHGGPSPFPLFPSWLAVCWKQGLGLLASSNHGTGRGGASEVDANSTSQASPSHPAGEGLRRS
jgi:hypothetical protein